MTPIRMGVSILKISGMGISILSRSYWSAYSPLLSAVVLARSVFYRSEEVTGSRPPPAAARPVGVASMCKPAKPSAD